MSLLNKQYYIKLHSWSYKQSYTTSGLNAFYYFHPVMKCHWFSWCDIFLSSYHTLGHIISDVTLGCQGLGDLIRIVVYWLPLLIHSRLDAFSAASKMFLVALFLCSPVVPRSSKALLKDWLMKPLLPLSIVPHWACHPRLWHYHLMNFPFPFSPSLTRPIDFLVGYSCLLLICLCRWCYCPQHLVVIPDQGSTNKPVVLGQKEASFLWNWTEMWTLK